MPFTNFITYIIEYLITPCKFSCHFQMGIFRKAGVKSRIAKLRTTVEAAGASNASFAIENINTIDPNQSSLNFDGAQAHDVADMVKQYFRELPDALLTNKLSETFIAIFQRKFC